MAACPYSTSKHASKHAFNDSKGGLRRASFNKNNIEINIKKTAKVEIRLLYCFYC